MIKNWQTHQEYRRFLHEAKVHFDNSQRVRLTGEFAAAREKLRLLNLDPVMELLEPFYPPVGRPAINQPQVLRSLVLMLDQGFTGITIWVEKLSSDSLLAFLIGCTPDSLPPLGPYYDFIDRLWLQDRQFHKSGRKDLFPANKNKKPANKPGKGKKLPNRHPGITKAMAEAAVSRDEFPFYYEKLLHQIFRAAVVIPSIRRGIISNGGITLSGDGTCVHTHASPYGHKVCKCLDNGESHCNCPRHYSDPDAHWGWDSDLGAYYFGCTLYMLSYHNSKLRVDLPLHIRFLDARRHDSVSGIVTLKEFRGLNPDVATQNLCFDSANDNYPTYNLCKIWDIRPFTDLNNNCGRPKSIPDEIKTDQDGAPVCQAGYRMAYWGYCAGRSRCKWRCPLACRKVGSCPCKDKCPQSPYGRCIYTKPDWDARLYTPVARGTREYKKIYKDRTSCERVNNRILNDYHLHSMGIHRRKRYTFFAVAAGINIHLDAWMKKQNKTAS